MQKYRDDGFKTRVFRPSVWGIQGWVRSYSLHLRGIGRPSSEGHGQVRQLREGQIRESSSACRGDQPVTFALGPERWEESNRWVGVGKVEQRHRIRNRRAVLGKVEQCDGPKTARWGKFCDGLAGWKGSGEPDCENPRIAHSWDWFWLPRGPSRAQA